jgi:hypothetical protein
MYLIAIAWMYVVLMMAIVEATSATGTFLGAAVTFIFYGLLPCGILMYLLGAPSRRKAINAKERAELESLRAQVAAADAGSDQPHSCSEAPANAITPVRKEL